MNSRLLQFLYNPHQFPVLLDFNFKVDPASADGKGIVAGSLKGPKIQAVFMNSSASVTGDTTNTDAEIINVSSVANLKVGMAVSGAGIQAGSKILSIDSATQITLTLPATATAAGVTLTYAANGFNPSAGIIVVQLQETLKRYYQGSFQSGYAVTGAALTATVADVVYVINALGTATLAQWQAVGLPIGITPAVGVSFIATASGTIGGSASVKAAGSSGVASVEYVGDPNLTLQSSKKLIMGVSSGAYLIFKCFDYAGAVVAPLAQSQMNMDIYLSNSKITVQGE